MTRLRSALPVRFLIATLLCFAAAVALASPASAIRPDSKAVLSPVDFQILNRPAPVLGADGRMHLAYEIQAVNQSPLSVEIRKVAPRAQGNRLGLPFTGTRLAERTRINAGTGGTTLGPGGSAMLFIDAAYSQARKRPAAISHAISLAWPDAANPGELIRRTFIGVSSRVSRQRPVVLTPPLRGSKWVAANGCCTMNPHRGATLAIDGTVRVPERFAIDFVQMGAQNRLFIGPQADLFSYRYYRAPIIAAAPGRVVDVKRNLPEQIPGAMPTDATIQNAGGNHVVVDIGQGRFAFYAHMATRSVRVKVGQKVRRGEVLGLLGNSGNTDTPHLHFHVMDSPSPLQASGLPYVFRSFRGQGVLRNLVEVQGGDPGDINQNRLRRGYRNSLPMENQVVRFG